MLLSEHKHREHGVNYDINARRAFGSRSTLWRCHETNGLGGELWVRARVGASGVALSFDARNLSFYSFSGPERAEAE